MIIGISGTNSSGKDTVAKYIEEKGYFHLSLSDILRDEMKKQKIEINRDNMIIFSNNFGLNHGAEILAKTALEQYKDKNNLIISSIRKKAEVDFLHEKSDLKLFFVDVPVNVRYERMQRRAREGEDILSFEDFKVLQEKEMDGTNSQNLSYCKEMANHQIDNSGSLADLFTKIDDILE